MQKNKNESTQLDSKSGAFEIRFIEPTQELALETIPLESERIKPIVRKLFTEPQRWNRIKHAHTLLKDDEIQSLDVSPSLRPGVFRGTFKSSRTLKGSFETIKTDIFEFRILRLSDLKVLERKANTLENLEGELEISDTSKRPRYDFPSDDLDGCEDSEGVRRNPGYLRELKRLEEENMELTDKVRQLNEKVGNLENVHLQNGDLKAKVEALQTTMTNFRTSMNTVLLFFRDTISTPEQKNKFESILTCMNVPFESDLKEVPEEKKERVEEPEKKTLQKASRVRKDEEWEEGKKLFWTLLEEGISVKEILTEIKKRDCWRPDLKDVNLVIQIMAQESRGAKEVLKQLSEEGKKKTPERWAKIASKYSFLFEAQENKMFSETDLRIIDGDLIEGIKDQSGNSNVHTKISTKASSLESPAIAKSLTESQSPDLLR